MDVRSAVEAKVWLLHLKSSQGVRGSLSRNVIREICSYFQDLYFFAAISERSMEVYDFSTHIITKHQCLPTEVRSGYIQVDKTTVLIIGKKVKTLDLLTLQVTSLVPLLTPRNGVGVAQVRSTVFAFGEAIRQH